MMKKIIREAVCAGVSEDEAVKTIRQLVLREVPEIDRPKFLAMAETGLTSMHDGNFAEFGLRPSEFLSWQERLSAKGRNPG